MKHSVARLTETTVPRFYPLGAVIDPDFDNHAHDLDFLTDSDGTIWQDTTARCPREAH